MNRIKQWLASIAARRLTRHRVEPTPAERLQKSLRPDPDARARRLSQMDSTRRQRYFDAAYGEPWSLRGRG
jgi:hypothetical protein